MVLHGQSVRHGWLLWGLRPANTQLPAEMVAARVSGGDEWSGESDKGCGLHVRDPVRRKAVAAHLPGLGLTARVAVTLASRVATALPVSSCKRARRSAGAIIDRCGVIRDWWSAQSWPYRSTTAVLPAAPPAPPGGGGAHRASTSTQGQQRGCWLAGRPCQAQLRSRAQLHLHAPWRARPCYTLHMATRSGLTAARLPVRSHKRQHAVRTAQRP
jgi:hypothetical protein